MFYSIQINLVKFFYDLDNKKMSKNSKKLFNGVNVHRCMHNRDLPNWEWFTFNLQEKRCGRCIECLFENASKIKLKNNFKDCFLTNQFKSFISNNIYYKSLFVLLKI